MNNLFEELKGKDIRIKTWEEMCEMENTTLYESEFLTAIYFLDDNGKEIIHVDENMISDGWFRMAEDRLLRDRELVYYDNNIGDYFYLDINMFDILEETKLKALKEPELKEKNEFYVIEETTGKIIFEGTRRESFDYYKTHVDELKKLGKRIAVLRRF